MSSSPQHKERKPQSVDLHAGQRMRARRNMIGMSQERLAELTGITFQQIQKYERGANRMSLGRVHQFAALLGVTMQYFIDGFDGAPLPQARGFAESGQEPLADDMMTSKETLALLRLYYSVTDKDKRRKIVDALKSMININT